MKYHINVRATILCNATRLGSEISIVTPPDPFSSSFSSTSYIWHLSLLPGLQFISVRYASAPRAVWCACRTVSIGQESGRPSKVFEDLSGINSNYPLIPWKKQSETVSSHCIAIVSMGNCFPKNPKQSYIGFSKSKILIRTVNPKLWSYWTIVPNRSYELWLEDLLPFQRTTFIEHQRSRREPSLDHRKPRDCWVLPVEFISLDSKFGAAYWRIDSKWKSPSTCNVSSIGSNSSSFSDENDSVSLLPSESASSPSPISSNFLNIIYLV